MRPRLLFSLLLCVLVSLARAHDPFVAEVKGRADDTTVVIRLTFARSVAAHLAGLVQAPRLFYPSDRFSADKAAFDAAAAGLCALERDGRPLKLLRAGADTVADEDVDVVFSVVYARPESDVGSLRFSNPWLARLPAAENYTATFVLHENAALTAGPTLLTRETSAVEFVLAPVRASIAATGVGAEAEVAASSSESRSRPGVREIPRSGWLEFFKLGVEHIVTGYDHLLYLAALILGCFRSRLIVGIVTAFTLSHSLTLALATLGLVSPPSALVEQAIAATIVFVAIENLWLRGREPRLRQGVAFLFGLVHGFGFAGLLADLGVGANGGAIVVPLLAFNLGVEAGQLALIALVLPGLVWARRRPGFVAYGQPAASLAVALVGLSWFLIRL